MRVIIISKLLAIILASLKQIAVGELVIEGFGGNDKISGTSGNDYLIFNSENNTLYYDADGSGSKSDAVAIVVVGTMIDFGDIVVE